MHACQLAIKATKWGAKQLFLLSSVPLPAIFLARAEVGRAVDCSKMALHDGKFNTASKPRLKGLPHNLNLANPGFARLFLKGVGKFLVKADGQCFAHRDAI